MDDYPLIGVIRFHPYERTSSLRWSRKFEGKSLTAKWWFLADFSIWGSDWPDLQAQLLNWSVRNTKYGPVMHNEQMNPTMGFFSEQDAMLFRIAWG